MNSNYTRIVAVTPEYVLEVLRDEHRQSCEFDPGTDPDIDLTFESTVEDWRVARDLVGTRQLGRALNTSWGMSLSDSEWRNVLTPPRKRTLRDVATLIAKHSQRIELVPFRVAGTSCLPAAAFLTIKDYLAAAGVDVQRIAPSTLLHEYTRRHAGIFLWQISRLAPGSMPSVSVKSEFHDRLSSGCCIGGVLSAAACVLAVFIPEARSVFIGAVLTYQLIALIVSNAYQNRLADELRFGDLKTFRDLAVCIADGHSGYSIKRAS